jgi:hypothetical protein
MSKLNSVNRIISAKDYGGSARKYIRRQQQLVLATRGVSMTIKDLDQEPTGSPVRARIWQGQWIAECECNGASFVDPDEPIFFCFSCGNRAHGQKPRPVIFPQTFERLEIERLLLERPVNDLAGLNDMERAGMAKPILYVEVEVDDGPDIDSAMQAMANGKEIKPRTRKLTVPLTRSWEPHQSIADLHREQDAAIEKWKRELKKTI